MTGEHEQFADPVASANTLAEFRAMMAYEVNPVVWGSLGTHFERGTATGWNLSKWVPAIWLSDDMREVRMRT